MRRTYGRLTYARNVGVPGGTWIIAAEPHVVIRARRVLGGRVSTTRDGTLEIADTIDIAHDLAWFLLRYPLETDPDTGAHLRGQDARYVSREDCMLRILAEGSATAPGTWREPARTPRKGQQTVSDLVLATGRLLCTDPLGAGKSMAGVLIFRDPGATPALVVTLTGRMPEQWCEEVEKTLPGLVTHIAATTTPYDTRVTGRSDPRPAQLALEDPDAAEEGAGEEALPDVLVMNYAKLAGWAPYLAGRVRTVIFDEVQELRHADSDRYRAAAHIASLASYRLGLSNTPIYNWGDEAFNVLDALERGCLGTRSEYLAAWCGVTENGKTKVADPEAFRAYLNECGLVLGRSEAELGIELPPTIPVVHDVETDPEALARHAGDATRMAQLILDRSSAHRARWQASGEFDMILRQATGLAKAPYVAEYVRMLLSSERRVLLYGWHHAVEDIWMQMLDEFAPTRYTGRETNAGKKRAFRAFTEGDCRVLVMSLRSGAGLDGLQPVCRDVVFGELDWSPSVMRQCIGRLRRGGMDLTRPVRAHWLVARDGADPTMAGILNLKRMQTEGIFDPEFTAVRPVEDNTARVRALARAHLEQLGLPTPAPADVDEEFTAQLAGSSR